MADLSTWMRSFATTVECGSFTAAALRIGVTQSTISKQIVLLERHLGTALFHRTTRSLSLTDEGSAFYEAACQALAALEKRRGGRGP